MVYKDKIFFDQMSNHLKKCLPAGERKVSGNRTVTDLVKDKNLPEIPEVFL